MTFALVATVLHLGVGLAVARVAAWRDRDLSDEALGWMVVLWPLTLLGWLARAAGNASIDVMTRIGRLVRGEGKRSS